MVEQHFSTKEKGKGKAKGPEPSIAMDEQIAHLLQQLHEARVPENIRANVLNNPGLGLVRPLSLSLEEGEVGSVPSSTTRSKEGSYGAFRIQESLTQRALLVPYDDDVPTSDDKRMDKHPDFKASLSIAGLSTSVAAKAGLPKLAVAKAGPSGSTTAKAGPSRSTTAKAGSAKLVVAANPVVVATLIAFPANVLQGSEAGMIELLETRTYDIPTGLLHKYFLPVHLDP
ncbi:hypothetical protein J132_05844 [Termitomyces sp. J132]|nr:hypothetical protein J132_05844 [Termitomyces sp. J132]